VGSGDPVQAATWATDGTILLPGPRSLGLLVRVAGDATASQDAGGWQARITTLDGAVPMLDEPATGATTLLTVGRSRSLTVIGPPTQTRRSCWWPVEDAGSGLTGWVRLEHGVALDITGAVPADAGACWWPVEDVGG
jgi:hypothetical protein